MQLPDFIKPKKGSLPNLIIIGAQKCGTTSLHYYLDLHPQISMSKEKELNFFTNRHNWDRGIEWYESNFKDRARVHGESSPNYTAYPFLRGVPERMYSVVPEAKLIYILRDPIDRIVSHYLHNYAIGKREHRAIEAAFSPLDSSPYTCLSKYYMQLEQYINYFPKSNTLIITMEDLHSHHRKTIQNVFEFLNVDENFYSPKFLSIKHNYNTKGEKIGLGCF